MTKTYNNCNNSTVNHDSVLLQFALTEGANESSSDVLTSTRRRRVATVVFLVNDTRSKFPVSFRVSFSAWEQPTILPRGVAAFLTSDSLKKCGTGLKS